jgi:L-alanine-DL-glutamate epimerase-like enolase superfamily enzyme
MTAAVIADVEVGVYRFPTDSPEADGTLQWDATTAITVTLHAGGTTGLGWTYGSPAVATVVSSHLAGVVQGRAPGDIAGGWEAMHRACRNFGTRGSVGQAISAVDMAWWDLAARLMDAPLTRLLGSCRSSVPVYGSGGFTTFSDEQLAEQVAGWAAAGCGGMKIKIGESWGTRVSRDLARVRRLRELAGDDVELMVDANGGYTVGQARRVGSELDELGVVWFEEPVSSDDLAGLAGLRTALRCDVTAGEYASDVFEARQLLPVVDCLQLDVTRCGGYTGWRAGAALAAAANVQVSAHCAPALSAYACAAVPNARHIEWFADHAALEPLLVDGVPQVRDGAIQLDENVIGHGMSIAASAEKYRV